MPFKIVFMGTPRFSVPTLDALIKNNFNIIKVYTQPPKKSKRGQKINPTPVEVKYRGHTGKLFKRDFAAELCCK